MKLRQDAPQVGRRTAMAALLLITAGTGAAQEGTNQYSKPLERYTMEDLIYIRDEGTIEREKDVAKAWIRDAEATMHDADQRKDAAKAAREVKKLEADAMKKRKDQAKDAGDEANKTLFEEKAKSEETTVRILERIETMADLDGDFGKAWKEAGESLARSLEAGLEVARLRKSSLSRRDTGSTTAGLHLDPQTYAAYKKHAEAYENSAKKLKTMAERMEKRAREHKNFLEDLKKGGYAATQ